MITPVAQAERAAAPMKGPDFVIGVIKSYDDRKGKDGILLLEDGTRWRLLAADGDHDANSRIVELAKRKGLLFISGDATKGIVDRVAIPVNLAALHVGPLISGRYAVSFAGPPSIYYLHAYRPWAPIALSLLEASVAMKPPLDQPDLLVTVDVVSSEVMDVRRAK